MREQLRLDGTGPADLARQVRERFGPEARIVKAERVRTTRWWSARAVERYELTIEVPTAEEVASATHQEVTLDVEHLLATQGDQDAGSAQATLDAVVSEALSLVRTTAPLHPTRDQLRGVGVPDRLLPEGDTCTVAEVARRIGQAPALTDTEGDLVVVVGPAPLAGQVARGLHRKARVLRVGDGGVNRNPAPVGRLARGRVGAAGVVGVQVSGLGRAADHARDVLGDLDANQVLIAVDATQRVGLTVPWVERFAGTPGFVGLAACGCAQAPRPAAVLSMGHPVVLVDGRQASVGVWSALLVESLSEP